MTALITAADLGIDTTSDQGLFDWFLASLLFGRPVSQNAAASAFHKLKSDGWDRPDHSSQTTTIGSGTSYGKATTTG